MVRHSYYIGWCNYWRSVIYFNFCFLILQKIYGLGPKITGVWHTTYQSSDLPDRRWVKEDIKFWYKAGNLRFKTYNNEQDEAIEGDAELFRRDHILGRWRQRDERSSSHGVFMLTIAPSGKLMYGFWAGISESGEKRFGGWVHARYKESLSEGQAFLSQVTAELSEECNR